MPARGEIMNIHSILEELRGERDRIERAISAIESLNSTGSRKTGRQPTAATRKRRGMSIAARRKLSLLMKKRWAQGKMRPKASPKATQTSKRARLSRAARKRIAAAQRARWAKVKEQAQKKAA
jgi:hypothetical protein